MTGRDIVDDIDALIDEQLAAGEDGQARRAATAERRCGHCGRAWHGLAITARMEEMHREYLTSVVMARMRGEEFEYAESAILGDYRYADDDSTVLCPGSEFIGPLPSTCDAAASLTDDDGCQCPDCLMWRAVFGGGAEGALRGLWQLPDDPLDPASWLTRPMREPARWWRLDITAHPNMEEFTFETEGVGVVRGMVGPPARTTLIVKLVDGRTGMTPLITDPDTGNHAHYTVHETSRRPLTLDVYAPRPHDLGGRIVWHEIDGPGGHYVRSRALVSSTRVDRWFDDHGLWFLAPREFRAVRRRVMGFAFDDGGPIRPGRIGIRDGAPYLPVDVSMPQRGDRVGYAVGGRVYTGYVTDFEPGPRGDDETVLRLDGSHTEEFAITLNDPDPSIRRLFGLASDGGL
ncbi:hypothetical protein PBI_BLUEBERRY_78 [Gordonia phage Blueberry]|uniref:Uncharacterized protein n=1 Tax=Gordonia phage Azula TaxID=2762397 RepID=A0A7G8LKW8_9CAUD|nr:DNA binding protein [Gordonia phage Blueberry]YP_010110005.1 DNA binding protein [Gordonia phage Azula]QGJ97453.1 hypothetical protein SEA_GAMBINO_81 [Gordonia phage Gambino]QZD97511.1 hypothetical protein SEA_MISSRONA_79 [Gordonia phage MissRona]ANA85540.1 hypothetical protein PBI_BLUEBERRY_78 [Gordonia phage Blueberry]QNJ57890.1 hypothetical protein SEA_AZULA_79 [Gordonia phage Azula]